MARSPSRSATKWLPRSSRHGSRTVAHTRLAQRWPRQTADTLIRVARGAAASPQANPRRASSLPKPDVSWLSMVRPTKRYRVVPAKRVTASHEPTSDADEEPAAAIGVFVSERVVRAANAGSPP